MGVCACERVCDTEKWEFVYLFDCITLGILFELRSLRSCVRACLPVCLRAFLRACLRADVFVRVFED